MENKENRIQFPDSNTLEQNALLWAEHYNNRIKPGHGLFIEFKDLPEFRIACIECITKYFGWIQEKPYFLRKPKYLFRHINLN